MLDIRQEVKLLLRNGVYDPREIFNRLYPLWNGHYAHLRKIISEEKDR